MTIAYHWESRLLELANEAIQDHTPGSPLVLDDGHLLERAYQHCEDITRRHSKTFFMASQLLPLETRRYTRALYAFCRVSDDIVDRGSGDIRANLSAWRERTRSNFHVKSIDAGELEGHELVALAWEDTRRKRSVPSLYADQLLEGVAQDMDKKRYANFPELAEYCYGVACTVGLMSMHITGYSGAEAIPYAIRLGVALQMTNILRDVGEDWRAGRLYLPHDELACFDLSEDDINRGVVDERWREFMRFQISRNRRLYAESLPGVALLNPAGRFAIAAAGELYRAILDDIEVNDYNVFTRRASIGTLGKLRRLPGIWHRTQFGKYPLEKLHPF